MRVLVLRAHPDTDRVGSHVSARAVAALEAGGHTVDAVDLYDLDGAGTPFSPVLTAAERRAYHGPEPVVDETVADQIERLRAAGALLVCYPTWAGGVPAVFKGWLDRVLVPGVGFRFDEGGRVRPGLTHLRHLGAVTVSDQGRLRTLVMGDGGRATIARRLRATCGWRTRFDWLALRGRIGHDPAVVERFATRVESRMRRW